jgi:hypothetical protein
MLGPYSIRTVGSNPDPYSKTGSGSGEVGMIYRNEKLVNEIRDEKAGYFSCALVIL